MEANMDKIEEEFTMTVDFAKALVNDRNLMQIILLERHTKGNKRPEEILGKYFQKYNRVLENDHFFDRKESTMDGIKNHLVKTHHINLPVPTKKLAEDREFTLVEKFKHHMTNRDHGKFSMSNVYLLNSVNAWTIADILVKMMFVLKFAFNE